MVGIMKTTSPIFHHKTFITRDIVLSEDFFYSIPLIFHILSYYLYISRGAIELKLSVYNSVKRFRFNPGRARQRISVERRRISEQDT